MRTHLSPPDWKSAFRRISLPTRRAQCARRTGDRDKCEFANYFAISEEDGGREGIRTPDPLLAKQVLSQLSYTPTAETFNDFKAFAAVRKLRKTHFLPPWSEPYVETGFGGHASEAPAS